MKTSKLKSIEAILKGYILFRVVTDNEVRNFRLYHKARDYRLSINERLLFQGFSIFHGWTSFYQRY